MDLKNVIILISILINGFLGFFVLSRNRKKAVNRLYGAIALSVIYWSVAMVFYRLSPTVEGSILWCKILYSAPPFIVSSFYFFSSVFPERKSRIRIVGSLAVTITSCLLIGLSLFSDVIVKDVIFNPGHEKTIVFGGFYLFYSFAVSAFFIWSYAYLIKKYLSSNGVERGQILYVFWGTFLASTSAMLANLLLPSLGIFSFNWLGQVLSLLMDGFIAYAIVRHRLMDVKLVMRKSTVYALSFFSVLILALLLDLFIENILKISGDAVNIIILIAALLFFNQIKAFFYHFANKHFFSSLYDPAQVIDELSSGLKSTIEIASIYRIILDTILSAFHSQRVAILKFHKRHENFTIQCNHNFSNEKLDKLMALENFGSILAAKEGIILVDNLRIENNLGFKEVKNGLSDNIIELILPLRAKNELVGYLLLGPKESGDMYNEDDLRVLRLIGSQGAMAIQNARLYEKTQDFRSKAEKEIAKKSQELISANDKLIKLDDAKSEFISIASHQLRTPLTVIKGYVSMMLEGTFGPVSDKHQAPLEKVFLSNERLVHLVDNLLTISRLESGRLQFKFEPVQLEDIIDQIVKQFTSLAKKTNIKVNWQLPDPKLPQVSADSEKIRQAILHLVDNSFRYTKQGTINIKLEKSGGMVRFSITDTGVGILPEDLPNLFQKFSRGEGTFLLHTEGTGLGLYVAKEIVKAHHGYIWAESKGLNMGSQFYFEMPVIS